MNIGFLIARLVLGLLMAGHGAQKLFGWFGGYGLEAVAGYFENLGFRPGRLFAVAAALSEIVSGLLVALGFLGPIGPAIMLSVMIVAAVSVHWGHGVFAANNGIEVPLLYAAGAAALGLTGPGRYSLDALLGLSSSWTPVVTWTVLAIGVVAGAANLAARRPMVA
jgi:putative oxidoreductase